MQNNDVVQSLFNQHPGMMKRRTASHTVNGIAAAMVAKIEGGREANERRLSGLVARNRKRAAEAKAKISNSVAEAQEKTHLASLEKAAAELDKKNTKSTKGGK